MFITITRSLPLLAVLALGSAQIEGPKTCNITEDIQGECIVISLCPRAIQLIQLNDYKSLRDLTCGYDKLDAKVCCVTTKTDSAIIFKNTTEEIPHKPDQLKPTIALPPDLYRTERPAAKPTPAASIPTTRVTSTTPYPFTTPYIPKETKSSVEHRTKDPHRGDASAAAAPTQAVPIFTNPQAEYEIGREPEQSDISPSIPTPGLLPPTNSNPNLVPPSVGQGIDPTDILPNRNVCGQMYKSDKIYGGKLAGIDEMPWLARIKYLMNSRETYACHGSLITDRYLLTAAHCVVGQKIIDVRLGEWDAETDIDCVDGDCSDPPVDVKVDVAYVHPKYNRRTLVGDIALLRLATPVNFTEFIQPVCLPVTDTVGRQDYDLDHEYITGGWGRTEYEIRSVVKRKVKISPVAMDTCRVAINRISDELASSTICAGGRRGEDSCAGDSGSSLVKQARENRYSNWFIYGITSFGPKTCGVEGLPGIYTRITYYMDWILGTLISSPK